MKNRNSERQEPCIFLPSELGLGRKSSSFSSSSPSSMPKPKRIRRERQAAYRESVEDREYELKYQRKLEARLNSRFRE